MELAKPLCVRGFTNLAAFEHMHVIALEVSSAPPRRFWAEYCLSNAFCS